MNPERLILSLGAVGICFLFHEKLESDPVTHLLVQLPVLTISGYLFVIGMGGQNLRITERLANAFSLVAVFGILFWMLPRYIDATLVSPVVELAKFISIPVLVGGSLAIGWAKSNPFLRGFLKANAISMLGVLAFLYIHAPVRICNSYLLADQERLGFAFFISAVGLGIAWAIPLFFPPSKELHFQNSQ